MDIGSAKARFERIYRKEADAVFRFSLWRTSDREAALDITQECFMRYWDELSGGEIENDRALLFTIARRLVIDRYRAKKTESLEAMKGDDEDPFEPADESAEIDIRAGSEAREALRAIDSLSPPHRQAIYLRFVEDLGPKEIAEALGITPSAASVRIHRGVEELKKMMGTEGKRRT